ncbi:MAG: hypothetical protein KA383_09905 [Phycisphaerae bacterium]|nr:hypothetical protein [Phycisphaerae bacterium]
MPPLSSGCLAILRCVRAWQRGERLSERGRVMGLPGVMQAVIGAELGDTFDKGDVTELVGAGYLESTAGRGMAGTWILPDDRRVTIRHERTADPDRTTHTELLIDGKRRARFSATGGRLYGPWLTLTPRGWDLLAELDTLTQANRQRRKGGRPTDTDPRADAQLAAAWESGHYSSHEELAKAKGETVRQVKLALERNRKRQSRKGVK